MKIFPKLLISFLVLSLTPLLIITIFSSQRWTELAKQERIDSLSEILESRIGYLEEYFANLKKDAILMGRTEDLSQAMKFYESHQMLPENNTLKKLIQLYAQETEISDAYLITQNGDIVFSLKQAKDFQTNLNTGPFNKSELAKVYQNVKASFDGSLSSFDIYPVNQKPAIFVGAPIFYENEFVGVFVYQIPPKVVYRIFHDYTSLKETGEVLIAKKVGDKLLFVNPIRHKPDAAFKFSVPSGAKIALPMQQAIEQVSGKGESIDYRNQKILAVWDYFPLLNWGVVVKIDLKEALEPVKYVGNLLFLIGGITLLIVILVVVFLARLFSNPIKQLESAFKEVGKGQLDVDLNIYTNDEVGSLSQSFLKMLDDLKKSTTSIEILNQEVEQRKTSEQIKTELISRISHELRTPIMPIIEGVNLLINDSQSPPSENHKQLLDLIKSNAERLQNLVSKILNLKELNTSDSLQEFKETDINELVEQAISEVEKRTSINAIELRKELDPNLRRIACNAEQLRHAIASLIDNAFKFTEKGYVAVKTSQKDGNFEISIEDTGIGISEEDQKKLFQEFRELNLKTDDKTQGFGLGLAFCLKIIEQHSGTIIVDSTYGKGSTFIVQIPIQK